jgi:twitching motility protein PilT
MRAIDALFDRLLERKGSDLHLSVGYPPMLRVRGELVAEVARALTAADVDGLINPLLSPDQASQFATSGDLDFAHAHGTRARFRANYLRKTTGPGPCSARSSRILSMDALRYPQRS